MWILNINYSNAILPFASRRKRLPFVIMQPIRFWRRHVDIIVDQLTVFQTICREKLSNYCLNFACLLVVTVAIADKWQWIQINLHRNYADAALKWCDSCNEPQQYRIFCRTTVAVIGLSLACSSSRTRFNKGLHQIIWNSRRKIVYILINPTVKYTHSPLLYYCHGLRIALIVSVAGTASPSTSNEQHEKHNANINDLAAESSPEHRTRQKIKLKFAQRPCPKYRMLREQQILPLECSVSVWFFVTHTQKLRNKKHTETW